MSFSLDAFRMFSLSLVKQLDNLPWYSFLHCFYAWVSLNFGDLYSCRFHKIWKYSIIIFANISVFSCLSFSLGTSSYIYIRLIEVTVPQFTDALFFFFFWSFFSVCFILDCFYFFVFKFTNFFCYYV